MRALLSVYDKTGIVTLAQGLVLRGWEIVSTGGTQAALQQASVPVTAVADVTNFPEILDGRVKTLHPNIHGGLLARRDDPDHRAQLHELGIQPIDLIASNLYPFEQTVADEHVSLSSAIEQIDIGGPAMIRAASKNFAHVVVISDPADYEAVLTDLDCNGVDLDRRRQLAARAFAHVAAYDAVVAAYLRGDPSSGAAFPEEFTIAGRRVRELRYGENPRQRSAAYRRLAPGEVERGVLDARQLAGTELSFNNLLDADAAWRAIIGFDQPAVSVVKHTIPCGLAVRPHLSEAFAEALAGDPVSAFGGIVALNREVDEATARLLAEVRFDVVIAPGFREGATARLTKRRSLRLLVLPYEHVQPSSPWDVRLIRGGLLVQDADSKEDDRESWRVVTRRAPTEHEWRDLVFAWKVVRHVKSNAIVIARNQAVLGVGSGQPNRVESVRIATSKADSRARGAALASDAFFPFADGLRVGIDAGVATVVQPGGSVRDQEVIDAADSAGIAMVFTGTRHFRH